LPPESQASAFFQPGLRAQGLEFFARRVSCKCQGVDAAGQLLGDELIDHPVASHAGDAGKLFRHDEYAKMAFSRSWRGAVSGVFLTLIDDIEPDRFQSDNEFFAYLLL